MASLHGMKSLSAFPRADLRAVTHILCDLDDTLTTDGRLPAASYAGLEQLSRAGKKIIIVTGRPAGWCDMIARFWPVDGVVGENGAFYFRYLRDASAMVRRFRYPDAVRERDRKRLGGMFQRLRRSRPELRLASDQPFRVSDIAIDICEDVEPLSKATVDDIVARLEGMGATVKVSSIHVNAWIGRFDKLSMIKTMLRDEFGVGEKDATRRVVYVGDSPNDEPMFAFFPRSVGVRNIDRFVPDMKHLPAYIAKGRGGAGFLEVARLLTPTRSRVS
jgi:HAD superfamily hydrolase (TIGR01484 family)